MKVSTYTSILHINNRHTLLFNAFTQKFVIVRNKVIDLSNNNILSLSAEFPDLYQQLTDAEIIVDESLDEVLRLRKLIIDSDNNASEYILHINPTLDCNFNCWYCYENHIPHSRMDTEVLNGTLRYIDSVLQNPEIKTFELGFFGGEPLFHFNRIAKTVISHVADICTKNQVYLHVHFTSNGALLTDEIIAFLSQFNCGFQITLDGGKDEHDRTRYNKSSNGSYDIIINNIIKLSLAKIDTIVRVNYTSTNIDSVWSILDSFSDIPSINRQYIKFDFQRVWQDRSYSNDETGHKIRDIRQKFQRAGYIVLANYIPHNVTDSCYGDKINHILINYNGDVFGCTARDFTIENRIGQLDSKGVIHFNNELVDKRNNSKLSKSVCQNCRIAPLCGGGCKQRAIEDNYDDRCTLEYSESDMDRIILDIFKHSFNLKDS